MAFNTWLLYLVACIGLSLSPGPNGLLALTHGALHGSRKTLFTIGGGASGFFLVIALCLFGIGALPGGLLVDRFGSRVLICACLAGMGLSPAHRYVGFMGNFAHWQGVPLLVDALPDMLRVRPNIHLLLAGQGPDREAAETRARELGVAENVTFLDPVAYDRIPLFLGALDVALLPTRPCFYVEAGRSPMKLYDYAAAGKAIVAAAISGLEAWAEEGWLVTYSPGDAADLAAAVVAIVNDPGRRQTLETRARQVAETRFAWRHRIAPLVAPQAGGRPPEDGP